MAEEKYRKLKRQRVTLELPSEEERKVTSSLLSRLLGPVSIEQAPTAQIEEKINSSQELQKINPVEVSNPVEFQPGENLQPGREIQPGKNSPQGYLRLPNEIIHQLLPRLKPVEGIVYLHLYALSYGFGRNTCKISMAGLGRRINSNVDTARKATRDLVSRGLIRINYIENTGTEAGGIEYEVFAEIGAAFSKEPGGNFQPGREKRPGSNFQPGRNFPPMKDHDDDYKNKDHHQSAHARATMTTYQSITGNNWTKADQDAYQKIKDVSLAIIEQGIRMASQRAASKPNSLAYFVKEILNLAHPSQQSKTQRKNALGKIVACIRELHVGQRDYRIADLVADVKNTCAREGVVFDNDLFNEIIGIQ